MGRFPGCLNGPFPLKIQEKSPLPKGASREPKRHIKLLHIRLCPVAPVTAVLPVGYPDKKIYVPWVPRIAHKTLTPGLPVGRPPGHRRGPPVTGGVTGQKDLCLCA